MVKKQVIFRHKSMLLSLGFLPLPKFEFWFTAAQHTVVIYAVLCNLTLEFVLEVKKTKKPGPNWG